MKHISIPSVISAFEGCKGKTLNKFWGVVAILKAINQKIIPAKPYVFGTADVSNWLEEIFRFDDTPKVYKTSAEWTVIFSNHWIEYLPEQMFSTKPNIYDVATWFFRTTAFDDEITAEKLIGRFLDTLHLEKEEIEDWFSFEKKDIQFTETSYRDSDVLLSFNQSFSDSQTISFESPTFIKSRPGALGQAPFVQTLYANQATQKCLILTQLDFNDFYPISDTNKDMQLNLINPLQQIFYGAPGTGKSHRVNEVTEAHPEENVFRTTFHPDSDYSTFVGCYKPTKEPSLQKQPILDYDSLVDKLKEYLAIEPVNITRSCALFGYDYHDSIVKMQDGGGHTIPSLVADAYKSGTTYDSTVRAGMSIYESGAKTQNTSSTITYTFVPQAFTKAYIRAWQTEEPVYLVIEEINRGNCAQIFGDLFQLLDRKEGKSEYPIKPDTDLGNFIAEKLSSHVDGTPEKVVNGELMILPKNLYIWATMNTSDQSLFPIDSAFKRRWDWEYIPIADGGKNWKIVIGTTKFDWWRFIEKINSQIGTTTSSEDKKLGYFFCKDNNGIIDEKTFVGKVLFYLWNDVFKNYDLESQLFKDNDGGKLTFDKLYKNVAGQTVVNQDKVLAFLRKLDNTINPSVLMEETDDETSGYIVAKFSLNGGSPMPMTQIAKQVVADYADSHPSENGKQIRDIFNSACCHIVVETEDEYNERQEKAEKTHGGQELVLANGEKIYTSNQWEWKSDDSNFARFIVVVREKGWGDIVEIPTNK